MLFVYRMGWDLISPDRVKYRAPYGASTDIEDHDGHKAYPSDLVGPSHWFLSFCLCQCFCLRLPGSPAESSVCKEEWECVSLTLVSSGNLDVT